MNPNNNTNNHTSITDEMRKALIQKVMDEGYNIKDAALLSNINYNTAFSIIKNIQR